MRRVLFVALLLAMSGRSDAQFTTLGAGGSTGIPPVNQCPGGATGQADFSSACNSFYLIGGLK